MFSLYSKSNLSIFIYLTACDLWCVLSKLLPIKSNWWSWRHENDVWPWSLYHCYSMYCVPNSDQHINSLKSSQYTVKWVGVENFTIMRVTSIRNIAYTVTLVATIMYFKFLLWRGDTSCCKRESYERERERERELCFVSELPVYSVQRKALLWYSRTTGFSSQVVLDSVLHLSKQFKRKVVKIWTSLGLMRSSTS